MTNPSSTIEILGYGPKVTAFDSYDEAATARDIAFNEDEAISHGGCNYVGSGQWVVWLSVGDNREYYL